MSHPVDRYVGARIRAIRLERGLSQTDLADCLGLSFQQVQKYERGSNRISASKLYEAAEAFEVSICAFYEDLPMKAVEPAEIGAVGSALREVVQRMRAMSIDKQEDVRLLVRVLGR